METRTVPRSEPPAGLIPVAVGKACVLLLTSAEFTAGLKRGKVWRRRVALAKRLVEQPRPLAAPESAIPREDLSG